jgi:hypothetical protein
MECVPFLLVVVKVSLKFDEGWSTQTRRILALWDDGYTLDSTHPHENMTIDL